MSSHAEEQAGEIEVLSSIYDKDFIVGAPTQPIKFRLKLTPAASGDDPRDNHVAATLHVTLPLTYPDVLPILSITGEKGLAVEQLAELTELAVTVAEENAGAPLCYAVAERLREWLQEHNEPAGEGSAYDEMLKRQRAAERAAANVGKPTGVKGGAAGLVDTIRGAARATFSQRDSLTWIGGLPPRLVLVPITLYGGPCLFSR